MGRRQNHCRPNVPEYNDRCLYATFGSKHELYLKTLDRCLLKADPSPLGFLSRLGPALPLVRALVERYAQDAACDRIWRGCMIVNAALERLPDDRLVARRVEVAWDGPLGRSGAMLGLQRDPALDSPRLAEVLHFLDATQVLQRQLFAEPPPFSAGYIMSTAVTCCSRAIFAPKAASKQNLGGVSAKNGRRASG